MTAGAQEGWMAQLEVNVLSGYKSFLDGWQTASTMLQEQVDKVDILNPSMGCTCKRACDNGQLIMPVVVADDEVSYPSTGNPAAAPSPFSPRDRDWGRIASANPMPSPQITTATCVAPPVHPEGINASIARVASVDRAPAPVQQAIPQEPMEQPPYMPPVDYIGNFGYYAEYVPVPRPASSICSTTVSTAVRAAPWEKWVKPEPKPAQKSQAKEMSCQTGSSLISRGGAVTSQAASVLQNLQPQAKPPAQEPVAVPSFEQGAWLNSEFGLVQNMYQPPAATPEAASENMPSTTSAPAPREADIGNSKPTLEAVQEVEPQGRAASPAPPAARTKAKSQAKSVLSQSTALKSSAAMALSQASVLSQATPLKSSAAMALSQAAEVPKQTEAEAPKRTEAEAPKRIEPKPPRASDRKSALSVMTPMNSSAAMALGGLAKTQAKRHGSAERSSTESVLPGAKPTTTAPASVVDERPKPARPQSRNGGSRSKGPDAKSVISGLNSSSSAAALLGPMMQGQPKRRSMRPEGADVASVV